MGNIPNPADRLEPSSLAGKFFPSSAFRVQPLSGLHGRILILARLSGRGYQASGHPGAYGHRDGRRLLVDSRNRRDVVTQRPHASRRTIHSLVSSLICLVAQGGLVVSAAEPYFVGYETEPIMDYGGRTVVSLHQASSRLVSTRQSREMTGGGISHLYGKCRQASSGALFNMRSTGTEDAPGNSGLGPDTG
jgi:hypothetical protein